MEYAQVLGFIQGYLSAMITNDKITKKEIELLISKIDYKLDKIKEGRQKFNSPFGNI